LNRILQGWIEAPPDVSNPPEIRRSFLTLTQAQITLSNGDPSWTADLKGDLQMHTQWSDGSGTVEEMARAAAERGYEYIAITDHSKGLKIAGGMDEEQLSQQAEEIQAVNGAMREEGFGVKVLASIGLKL